MLLSASFVFSQNAIKVARVTSSMSQGERPSFTVTLPKADVKLVEKAWASAVEDKGKSKAVKATSEWVITKTLLPKITQDAMSVNDNTNAIATNDANQEYIRQKTQA